MIPTHYSLIGHYAGLIRRLEKISGGTATAKRARAAAIAALKDRQEALIATHRKLTDALDEYEAGTAAAISDVNRALSTLRSSPLPAGAERPVEAAMHSGAKHLDSIHRLLCDGLEVTDIISTATLSSSASNSNSRTEL